MTGEVEALPILVAMACLIGVGFIVGYVAGKVRGEDQAHAQWHRLWAVSERERRTP